MDPRTSIALLPGAARAVTAVVEDIPRDVWGADTPCGQWSVRQVLNHLTAEQLWAPRLLRGETVEEVGHRYDGDVLGPDPVDSWHRAVAGSVLAWGEVEDVDRPVSVSSGPLSTAEYARQMLLDLTVHGWDLARGAGVAVRAVPDAVEASWGYEKARVDSGGVAGIFGPPVATESEHRLEQLVALLGRDPQWPGR